MWDFQELASYQYNAEEKYLIHEVSYSSHIFRSNIKSMTSFEKYVGVVSTVWGGSWTFEVCPERK